MIAPLLLSWIGLVGDAQAGRLNSCEFNYPIAGSAGFSNAQKGRQTNRNTYSAANFAERSLVDGSPAGQWVMEWNATLNAARVPTLCGDSDVLEHERKDRLYEDSLDLYASNFALSFEAKSFGAFYSASVTQSVMGLRYAVLPTMLLQLYPLVSAPFVGIWQRGDGVSSYSLDWIGGAHVDTEWFGARVGYTGIGGAYASFDERTIGFFGSTALPFGVHVSPWSYLKSGIDRFDPARFGATKVSETIGMTSLFVRDLPYGQEIDSLLDQGADTSAARMAISSDPNPTFADTLSADAMPIASLGERLEDLANVRLRTLHFEQKSIKGMVDVELSYALAPKVQVFDGMLAFHSPDYHPGRLIDRAEDREDEPGFMVKAGAVQLPAQYSLGVAGGTYFSARAEYRTPTQFTFMVLLNDPEQLALYPFATNAVSLRVFGLLDFE